MTDTENNTLTTTANGKTLQGVVVKSAMQDTITVAVERYEKHPKYQKFMRKTKKFLVHNPGNTVSVGDKVTIQETRPISKHKHFTLVSSSTSKLVAGSSQLSA
jgi:small subunit ribosomal protein S17